MAPRKGGGRKPAKNESAAALIAALDFISGSLKAPIAGSPEQYDYTFMNQGYAIGFNGVVAAGHPIPADIAGYPHTKLMAEALANTDKTFSMALEDDKFVIGSNKYSAIVPTMNPSYVIPTMPDNKQATIDDPAAFKAALEAVHKIAVDTGTTALYSSIRFTDTSFMATNGQVLLEALHHSNVPPVTVPRQFATALLKTTKTLAGIGINGADWSTLTAWFSDGSWVRTNLFGHDVWSEDVFSTYYNKVNTGGELKTVPPKMWASVKALLPFMSDDGTMLIRPGIIRTHEDRRLGAGLELAALDLTANVPGKALALLDGVATHIGAGDGVVCFTGENIRGILNAYPIADATEASDSGWGEPAAPAQEPQGWGITENVAPPPDEAPDPRTAGPQGEWKGGPAENLANDPEFLSQYHNQPAEVFQPEVEDAFIFDEPDLGINMEWGNTTQAEFKPSGWLNTLTDEDGGFTQQE